MPSSTPTKGINDLASKFPEIAKEADGWDPSRVSYGSKKMFPWKCKKGHKWNAKPNGRTSSGHGCPYCSNRLVLLGFNDLQSNFPEIAEEADGWDPTTVLFGSGAKMRWKCREYGHTWNTRVVGRTKEGKGCPVCASQQVWEGFNDLKTFFSDIAEEADGWDPTKVIKGSKKKLSWKCKAHGHQWEETPDARTRSGYGCPFCSNKRTLAGFNDLKTKFPEIAKEADGWDPTTLTPGNSSKKMPWKCKRYGHRYDATVQSRTGKDRGGCPVCNGKKVLVGFNDLKSKFPNVAKEADGWDPTTTTWGSGKVMPWKCIRGHQWNAQIASRCTRGRGCPYCSNHLLLRGFNDLETLFPDIAKEADGWDPSTVLSGSATTLNWKCAEGHTWTTKVVYRTSERDMTGCPSCAEHGFNPAKPAWFYLLSKPGKQQLGISNNFPNRMRSHASEGWIEIDKTGPHSGHDVLAAEKKYKKWLRQKIGLVPGTHEHWFTKNMEVSSLAKLKEKSGIKTSIF